MKIAVPDKISPSYFVAEAAVELGFFKAEGLDVSLELVYPVDKAYAALRDGAIDLRGLLIAGGIDPERDKVNIAPVPGLVGNAIPNFGVMAAKALEEGKLDGFWANGMGAEVAVRGGFGTVVVDARRGDGPEPCFNYTAAAVATSDALIARAPETVAAAVRAIVKTQAALKADVSRAGEVGRKLFPPSEAELIIELIRRDLPYYDATLSRDFIAGMTAFARGLGIVDGDVRYEDVVATQFAPLWKG
jgi:NitT/TauT family transport system substrate-binding protein